MKPLLMLMLEKIKHAGMVSDIIESPFNYGVLAMPGSKPKPPPKKNRSAKKK